MNSYEKMKDMYESLQGKKVVTDKYDGVVCGFHFKLDDNDLETIIVAIVKNKNGLPNGINYRLNGDVVKHRGELGYDYISIYDLHKYNLKP